jgi:hypothetical protein
MAKPVIPVKAKLFIGVLTSSEEFVQQAEKRLSRKYGKIDHKSANIPFSHTKYYNSLGSEPFKVLFSFRKLIHRERIAEIKRFTNILERNISGKNKRKINIDPGYLTLSSVFLASCKDYFHRAYLRKGVYIENELRYVNKKYEPWDWTYPDYIKQEYLDFFYNIRQIYYDQIRKK